MCTELQKPRLEISARPASDGVMKAVHLSRHVPVQSVTADFYDEEDRGKVFGTLHLTSAAGAAFGGLYATNMGEHSMLHACHTAAGRLTKS